jgi:hypothetical protein
MNIHRSWKLMVALAIILAIFVVLLASSQPFQGCMQQAHDYYRSQAIQQGTPPILVSLKTLKSCVGAYILEKNAVITALATIVIALFTFTIWLINRSQLMHSHRVERAYISGGGWRRFLQVEKNGEFVAVTDTRKFEFHANNYGKTPGKVFQLGWGFCEASSVPDSQPIYQTKYFDSWINPGRSGILLDLIDIPTNIVDPAVYGRIYYETIFGDRFSSGFLYRIPPRPGDSESIAPPNTRYTDDRQEN